MFFIVKTKCAVCFIIIIKTKLILVVVVVVVSLSSKLNVPHAYVERSPGRTVERRSKSLQIKNL